MRALSTPLAIVLGLAIAGAFTAGGVYFALRSRGAAATGASTSDGSAGGTTAGAGSADVPAVLSDEAKTRAAANDEVKLALDAQHAHLVEACWAPAFAKNPTPPTTTITFTMSFGPNGQPLARGLREDLATARPAVTDCVQKTMVVPPIAPRGIRTHSQYVLTLP